MHKRLASQVLITILLAAGITGIIAIFAIRSSDDARSAEFFAAHPVIDATDEQMRSYALEFTQANYIVRGDPTIMLSKPLELQEAFDIGFYVGVPEEAGRNFYTVILQGDFVRPATIHHEEEVFRFIAYVFDMEVGIPALTIDSVDGAAMKLALGDPSLPDLPADFFQPAGDIKDKRTHPIEEGIDPAPSDGAPTAVPAP